VIAFRGPFRKDTLLDLGFVGPVNLPTPRLEAEPFSGLAQLPQLDHKIDELEIFPDS
jgi:hypothetical protein